MSDYNDGLLPEPCLRLDFGFGQQYASIELGDGSGYVRVAENAKLRDELNKMDFWHSMELKAARAENARLRKLLRYNGAVIEACTGEILDHIGVPYIVGPAGVAQALMEATAMLVHKRYDFDPPSFYKEDK